MGINFDLQEWMTHQGYERVAPFLSEIAQRISPEYQNAFTSLSEYLRHQGQSAEGPIIAQLLRNDGLGEYLGQETLQDIFNRTIEPSNITTVPGGALGSNAKLQFNIADAMGRNETPFSGLAVMDGRQRVEDLRGFATNALPGETEDQYITRYRLENARATFAKASPEQQARALAAGYDPSTGTVSQPMVIPAVDVPESQAPAAIAQQATPLQQAQVAQEESAQLIQPQTYVIRQGDTLPGIAEQFGVPVSSITGYRPGGAGLIPGETIQINGLQVPQNAEGVNVVPEINLSVHANTQPGSGDISEAVAAYARFEALLNQQEADYKEQLAKEEALAAEAAAKPQGIIERILS